MNPDLLALAEAAKACAAKGLIRHNPQPRHAEAPKGKRSPRNGHPISPERIAEVTPEILRMVRNGYDYLSIIAKLGVTAKTITHVKRINGIPVKGDERDGKVFVGMRLNTTTGEWKEHWK